MEIDRDKEIELLEREENRFGTAFTAMNLSERLTDVYVRKAETDESLKQEHYGKALGKFRYLYEKGFAARQIMENIGILYQQKGEYGWQKNVHRDD